MRSNLKDYLSDCSCDMPFSIVVIKNRDELIPYTFHIIENWGGDNEESAVIHDIVLDEEDRGGLRYI